MTSFKSLMVQGTTSDAGKSTLVAALCRVLYRRGVRVAPFKPQNMALNSAVTTDGGEIGRAQAVQAQACGLLPHTDMNPVLLKPNSDTGCQVIIHGKVVCNLEATGYHAYKPTAMRAVLDSWQRLKTQYECVVVEGAGSPAEINLREGDIANMGFAEAVDCPVILIADIDRGGVFAHIVGTIALLSESERNRVIGFVINRFRGDIALLQPGLDWLEKETGKPVIGVLPYLHNLHLEAEDAVPLTPSPSQGEGWDGGKISQSGTLNPHANIHPHPPPARPFENLMTARQWVNTFVHWYNHEHRHSAIRFVTAAERHAGLDSALLAKRIALYETAKERHPERWSGATRNWQPVSVVYLNPDQHVTDKSGGKEGCLVLKNAA